VDFRVAPASHPDGREQENRMSTTRTFLKTSVGRKVVMAASGVIVFGFIVVHILGNLQLFAGPEALNRYAAFLQGLGPLKWAVRALLAASAAVHIVTAVQLTVQNWQARPRRYATIRYRATDYAARTMWIGGPIIGLFVIWHLLHLTTGHCHPAGQFAADSNGIINVYNSVVIGFMDPAAAAVYILAMLLVGLHLYHGLWSMMQSIGLNHPGWNHWRRWFAVLFAAFVALAGISLPVAVLTGFVTPA